MESALSTVNWLDRAADMVLVNLPSWGDPILPQTWRHSEEEIKASFTWPLHSYDSDNENDCLPMIMSDPLLEKEMVSLMQSSSADSEEESDYSSDEDSYCMRRDDDISQRRGSDCDRPCSVSDSSRSESRLYSSYSSLRSSDSDDMEPPSAPGASPSKFEWSVEAYYSYNLLCFKLRTIGGAYMKLQPEEVLQSLQTIVDDSMEAILFRVQRMDGQVDTVDSSLIIPAVSRILVSNPHVLMPSPEEYRQGLDGVDEEVVDGPPGSIRKPVRVRTFSGRGRKEYANNRKRKNRIGSAWRALSGRAKIRSRPPVPVE